MNIFSEINLITAYHNIPVAQENIPKTDNTVISGMFEFVRMPFGLSKTSQKFQSFMAILLRDMPFVQGYVDDLLIANPDLKSHD